MEQMVHIICDLPQFQLKRQHQQQQTVRMEKTKIDLTRPSKSISSI